MTEKQNPEPGWVTSDDTCRLRRDQRGLAERTLDALINRAANSSDPQVAMLAKEHLFHCAMYESLGGRCKRAAMFKEPS